MDDIVSPIVRSNTVDQDLSLIYVITRLWQDWIWCPDFDSFAAIYFGETVKNKMKTKLYGK